jgi:hypothetical protein
MKHCVTLALPEQWQLRPFFVSNQQPPGAWQTTSQLSSQQLPQLLGPWQPCPTKNCQIAITV